LNGSRTKTARRSGPFFCASCIAVAALIERLLGSAATLAGSLTLLSGLLTTALLLAGFLTRRLVLLAGLVLVRHVVSFPWGTPTRHNVSAAPSFLTGKNAAGAATPQVPQARHWFM